jgi:hypothetical protein
MITPMNAVYPASSSSSGQKASRWFCSLIQEQYLAGLFTLIQLQPVLAVDDVYFCKASAAEIAAVQLPTLVPAPVGQGAQPLLLQISATGDSEIEELMTGYRCVADDDHDAKASLLEAWLKCHPLNPGAAVLWLEHGHISQQAGNLVAAAVSYRKSCALLANTKPGDTLRPVAEEANAALAERLVEMGQYESLRELLAEKKGKQEGFADARLHQAQLTLTAFDIDPLPFSLCGFRAYHALALLLHHPRLIAAGGCCGVEARRDEDVIEDNEREEVAKRGVSATILQEKIRFGVDYRWIIRSNNCVVPVPSIAHLQFGGDAGHYIALLAAVAGHGYATNERCAGAVRVISSRSLAALSSGFFLMPASAPLPKGCAVADHRALQRIYGRQTTEPIRSTPLH